MEINIGTHPTIPGEPNNQPLASGAASIPPAKLDAVRQAKAREYARIKHWLVLVDLVIAALVLLILLFTGLAQWLKGAVAGLGVWQPLPQWQPLLVAAYFLALVLAFTLLNMPLSYYRGFILSHRYGLSTQTLGSWLADFAKGFGLTLIFELLIVEYVYVLLTVAPLSWWLWVGLSLLLVSVVLANLAPVLLLPLFYKITPLQNEELTNRLLALAQRAKTKVRGVFIMNMSSKTTAANAALMGLGNTRRIVLGDTLLDVYSADEIEVVLAHELGHHVHNDIWKLIATQTILTLGGLYLCNLGLRAAAGSLHYQGLTDIAALPLLALVLGLFGLVTQPLSNGYTRLVEYQADEYALETTHKTDAFISAMTRLANQNLAEVEPSPIIEILLYDHPAISKRIRHASEFHQR